MEVEELIKKVSKSFSVVHDDMTNLKNDIDNINKEIKKIKEQISDIADTINNLDVAPVPPEKSDKEEENLFYEEGESEEELPDEEIPEELPELEEEEEKPKRSSVSKRFLGKSRFVTKRRRK